MYLDTDMGQDTRERVVRIITRQVPKPPSSIKDTDGLVADIGADDFDLCAIQTALEDEFEIYLPEEEWGGCRTVADTVQVVERLSC